MECKHLTVKTLSRNMVHFVVAIITLSLVQWTQGFALPFEGLYRLDIIHYNDFHARFEETSLETPTCRYNNNSCLGGFPRLYYEIQELRKEKPDSILLNAGDSFQGTYWYTLLKWNVTQEFMNMLPHDAHAIGNHEFDDGPLNTAKYLQHLKAPMLVANMDTSKEPSLQGLYKNHTILTRKDRKIGIIGVTTVDTKTLSSPGSVEFTDPGEATIREARALSAQGVDIIILLSHCGIDVDKQLARDYGEYIDIIIGGHSHSLLWNGPAPSGEKAVGPYPVFVESTADEKHKVLIVQASAFTKYMGNLSVYFDYRGEYVKWDGGPIFLNRSIPEDEEIKKKLEPYAKLVHETEDIPVGESKTTLRFQECVYGECALGDFICDAFRAFAKENVKSDLDYLSFVQRGNIKATLNEGKITRGMIFELLPYLDRLEVFELQGRYVLEVLERGVTDAWAYNPFKGPWVIQLSGLRVTYNVSQPEGQRVTSVFVGGPNSTTPLDADSFYQVIAPAYLADGGDGFAMFNAGKQNVNVVGRDQEAVEWYIQAQGGVIDYKPDGRIQVDS